MASRRIAAAPVYVAAPALILAAITAATVLIHSARDELPDGLRPRRALISATASLPPPQDRLFGPPLRRFRLDDETQDFEPEAYSGAIPSVRPQVDLPIYYLDTVSNTTDAALAVHYLSIGRPSNRIYQRLRVIASYEPGAGFSGPMAGVFGGLCNQIYTHVGMLAVALHSGCEVVLPRATHRGGRQFQDNYDKGEIVPLREPLSTLFDVDHLLKWADVNDATFHRGEPDLDAFIMVEVSGRDLCCKTPLDLIVGIIRTRIKSAAESYLHDNPGRPLPPVRLVLKPPRLLFALGTAASHTELVEEISRNLRPAPHIQRLADTIVARLTAAGPYNGLHLRAEEDAHFWDQYKSREMFWDEYFEAMSAVVFNESTPLYVASGLLTYMNASEWDASIVARLRTRGVCSGVFHKESILADDGLEALPSEALALVDLLVLVQARRFTGFGASTFSWVVQELRCLAGMPTSTSSFPALSRTMLLELRQGGGGLSNHLVTCPDSSGAPQQDEVQPVTPAPRGVQLTGGDNTVEARLSLARAADGWSPCKDNPANCWFRRLRR